MGACVGKVQGMEKEELAKGSEVGVGRGRREREREREREVGEGVDERKAEVGKQ